MANQRYGIDLGTTNSVMATYKNGLKFMKNRQGEYLTPSWTTWRDDKWIVGEPAKGIAGLVPQNSVFSAKRLMGRNFSDPKVQKAIPTLPYKVKEGAKDGKCVLIEVDGKDYEPQAIAALVLRKMKEDAEYMQAGAKVEEVVITVPAYFNESQRAATMEAGRRAGLTVLAVLPEPAAAAYAYGTDPEKQDGRMILVYDLGGGTFDVTIIMACDGDFISTGLDGDMWLGGDDFDNCLVKIIGDHLKTKGKDPARSPEAMMQLRNMAEKAKKSLSGMDQTEIQGMIKELDNILLEMKIDRCPKCPKCDELCKVSAEKTGVDSEGENVYEPAAKCPKCGKELSGAAVKKTFEGAIAHLVQRTMDKTEKAMQNAGITADDLQEVLMVGGSTYVPMVQEIVRERFGADKVSFGVDAMQCVAQGAAVYAMKIPPRWKCPNDGTWNELSAKKCSSCGYKPGEKDVVDQTMPSQECPNCGEQMREGKCDKCGHKAGEIISLTAQAYGVELVGNRFGIVIEAGTQYPMVDEKGAVKGVKKRFYTHGDNQQIVDVPVFCGDCEDDVQKNDHMGDVIITLDKPVPKNTEVDVSFALDRSGVLHVTVSCEGKSQAADFDRKGRTGTEAKSVLDRITEIRQKGAAKIKPDAERKLSELQNRAVEVAGNSALLSANKSDEIEKINEELERIRKELGMNEPPPPAWINEAVGSVNLATLAIEKIGGLLDPDVAVELPKLTEALKRAVAAKDQTTAVPLTGKIDEILNDLESIPGKVFNGYLMTFRVRNPAQAEEYRRCLDRLAPQLAKGSFEAEEELDQLLAKISTTMRADGGAESRETNGPVKGITDKNLKGDVFLSDH